MVSLVQSCSLRVISARAEHLRADSILALWPVLYPLALQICSAAGPQSGEPFGASVQRSLPSTIREVDNLVSASVASLVAVAAPCVASRKAFALRSLAASIS